MILSPKTDYNVRDSGLGDYYEVAALMMEKAIEEVPDRVLHKFREELEEAMNTRSFINYDQLVEHAHDLVESTDDDDFVKNLRYAGGVLNKLRDLGYSVDKAAVGVEGNVSLMMVSFGLDEDDRLTVLEAGSI